MQPCKTLGLMQHAQYERCQSVTDPGNGAQGIRWMKFGVKHRDLATEYLQLTFQQTDPIDLDADLQLQVFKVDRCSLQALRFRGSGLEAVHQFVGERAAVRMIAAGMLGHEAEQCSAPCFGDDSGVEQVVQDSQREVGAEVWQHGLHRGAKPSAPDQLADV